MAITVKVDGKNRLIGKALDPMIKQAEKATADVQARIDEVEALTVQATAWFRLMLERVEDYKKACVTQGKQLQDRLHYLKGVESTMKAVASNYEKLHKLSAADRLKKIAEVDKRVADEEKRAMGLLSKIIDESAEFEKLAAEARKRLKQF
jgi:hypothetical protein